MIHVFEEASDDLEDSDDFQVWMGSNPSDKHVCDSVCVGSGADRDAALLNAFDNLNEEMMLVVRLLAHPPINTKPRKET